MNQKTILKIVHGHIHFWFSVDYVIEYKQMETFLRKLSEQSPTIFMSEFKTLYDGELVTFTPYEKEFEPYEYFKINIGNNAVRNG